MAQQCNSENRPFYGKQRKSYMKEECSMLQAIKNHMKSVKIIKSVI